MTVNEFFEALLQSEFARAILLILVAAFVGRWITAKGRLFWAVSHQHYYNMPRLDEDGRFPVRTQQIWFQNWGRAPVEEIEILLNYEPQHFEIWSPREHDTKLLNDGRLVIKVPNLAGQERFTLSMLDTFQELPVILNVRSKSGLGRPIAMAPQIILPKWVLGLTWLFIVLGVIAFGYLIFRLGQVILS